jgi:hypothetical protein
MNRTNFLNKVGAVINGQREDDYGAPEKNLKKIAILWGAYLGEPIRAGDVAAMMALLKIARLSQSLHHEDSWLDLAGYAAIGAETIGGDREVDE